MSENCTHDCSTCSSKCDAQDFREAPHPLSSVKHVIGVVSGKGGVGKSLVSAMLAVSMNRLGYSSAILDADITGPSIPKMFGIHERPTSDEGGLFPVKSKSGIDIMSINLLTEEETSPVIWRGPVIAGVVKQFWTDVVWVGEDYMFVDMPPGTGDVPLTVFQSLPVDGIVIVTSPQELVSMIVEKAVNMANMMNIPILGMVENMSYYTCPDCGKQIEVFGPSKAEEVSKRLGIDLLARIPINPEFAKLSDRGLIELFEGDFLEKAAATIADKLK